MEGLGGIRRSSLRQIGRRGDQDEADDPVRRLVPYGFQARHLQRAAGERARRRPRQGLAFAVHALEHDGDRDGVESPRSQVRLAVLEARVRALVCRRGYGGGRVLRGSRGPCRPRERLQVLSLFSSLCRVPWDETDTPFFCFFSRADEEVAAEGMDEENLEY